MFKLIKKIFKDFIQDECPRLAAALSFYAILSLPALLFLLVYVSSFFIDHEVFQSNLSGEIQSLIGEDSAKQIEVMISDKNLKKYKKSSSILSVIILAFGATGIMGQIQVAMNKALNAKPPKAQGLKIIIQLIFKRITSFAMVMTISFLLMISMALSAAISYFSENLKDIFLIDSSFLITSLDALSSIIIFWVLLIALYITLPDKKVRLKEASKGAAVASLLFIITKSLFSWYMSTRNFSSTYGSAASLVIVMLWVYFSALIVLFGAEVTENFDSEKRLNRTS